MSLCIAAIHHIVPVHARTHVCAMKERMKADGGKVYSRCTPWWVTTNICMIVLASGTCWLVNISWLHLVKIFRVLVIRWKVLANIRPTRFDLEVPEPNQVVKRSKQGDPKSLQTTFVLSCYNKRNTMLCSCSYSTFSLSRSCLLRKRIIVAFLNQ